MRRGSPLVADGQLVAPLAATTRENRATCFRGHACPESVRVLSLALMGLIRPLHVL